MAGKTPKFEIGFLGKTMLVLVIILTTGVGTVLAQQGPGYGVGSNYSLPDYLGQTMTIWIQVENFGSILLQVKSLVLSLDWGATLYGDAPRVIQPGQTSQWEFDNVQIPSYTWTGKHVFDSTAGVGWADSSGGFSNIPASSPFTYPMYFNVQQAPQPTSTTQPSQGQPEVVTVTQNTGTSIPDYFLYGILGWAAILLVILLAVAGLFIFDKKRRQAGLVQCNYCGSKISPTAVFCDRCGRAQR